MKFKKPKSLSVSLIQAKNRCLASSLTSNLESHPLSLPYIQTDKKTPGGRLINFPVHNIKYNKQIARLQLKKINTELVDLPRAHNFTSSWTSVDFSGQKCSKYITEMSKNTCCVHWLYSRLLDKLFIVRSYARALELSRKKYVTHKG